MCLRFRQLRDLRGDGVSMSILHRAQAQKLQWGKPASPRGHRTIFWGTKGTDPPTAEDKTLKPDTADTSPVWP